MSRRQARENAFQLIYERITSGERNALTFELFLKKNSSQEAYLNSVYNGVDENLDFLTSIVARYAKGFSALRIYKVDLSLLILACYEILFVDDVPDFVAVDEALELVKIYSTEKSAAFINGILARIIAEKEAILAGGDETQPEEENCVKDCGEETKADESKAD